MIKTEQEIERDFYTMIKSSELGAAIRGGLYRDGMRPDNSVEEDLIVKLLSGDDEQVQEGVILINLYVPDISDGKRNVKDLGRIAELQSVIRSFIHDNESTEYDLSADGTPKSMLNEEINQNLIVARIKYRRITI